MSEAIEIKPLPKPIGNVQHGQPGVLPHCCCPACPAAKAAGANFCPECGAPLSATVSKPSTPVKEVQAPQEPISIVSGAMNPQAVADSQVQEAVNAPQVASPSVPACECGHQLPQDACFCSGCGKKAVQVAREGYSIHCKSPAGQQVINWTGGEMTIGKAADCNLYVAGDEYLSRKHAKLAVKDGQVILEDSGSSNGTFLRIRRATPIEVGDEILVGSCLLRLEKSGA